MYFSSNPYKRVRLLFPYKKRSKSCRGMFNLSFYRTILLMLTLYSMSNIIEEVDGRFLWDLSSYCINYCSRMAGRIPPIGICSCHRITSYYRRVALDNPQQNNIHIINDHLFEK